MSSDNQKTKRVRTKGLSCQRCRSRKVKCDGGSPCSGCVKDGSECIRVTCDRRKERISHEYVDSLQTKIERLQSIISKVKDLVNIDEDTTVGNYDDHSSSKSARRHTSAPNSTGHGGDNSLGYKFSSLIDSEQPNRGVYGPTSIFESSSVQFYTRDNEIKRLNYDPVILSCIKLFFIWQYPDHNMFIYRESFLLDFFNPKPGCIYCSIELIFAICALGSSMATEINLKAKSKQFYHESKSMLLSKLDHSSIASMQALLLLAFYDICNGNNSSGWMLSGIAMRMGYDLGFQLNPNSWYLNESVTPLDCSIRSRIYWGFYLADHFISLLMGRPSSLKVSTTSIPETDDLPDLEWIAEYAYISPGVDKREIVYISAPLRSIIKLINISEAMINEIFTCITDKQEIVDIASNSNKLAKYNQQIKQWKQELPEDLQWDKPKLMETADNPTTMSIRYYYYIVLLCLNRPFIDIMKHQSSVAPLEICQEVIDDLLVSISRFKEIHGLQKATIYIVYCCILAVSVLMLTNGDYDTIKTFLGYLKECSSTWKLAEKSYKMIHHRLDHQRSYHSQAHLPNGPTSQPHHSPERTTDLPQLDSDFMMDSLDGNFDYFAGPPMLMTAELFNDDWEVLFPDYHDKRNKEE